MNGTYDNGGGPVESTIAIDLVSLVVTGGAQASTVLDDLLGGSDETSLGDIARESHTDALLGIFEEDAVAAALVRLGRRPLESFDMSSSGNADRFASRYGDRVLAEQRGKHRAYYVANRDNLWIEAAGEVGQMCDAVADQMEARARSLNPDGVPAARRAEVSREVRAGIDLAEQSRKMKTLTGWRTVSEMATDRYSLRAERRAGFDANPELISLAGGRVLELTAAGVRPRARRVEDMCRITTSVDWRPDVLRNPPEMIREFRALFLPEVDRAEKIFTVFGQALLGGNARRLFTFLLGGTTSGKTQLVNALIATLGGYAKASNVSIFRMSQDDRPRPDIIRVYDARLTFLAEASRGSWTLDGSRVKLFTGGDQDSQRGMRSDHFHEKTPQCMPCVYANQMPKIRGLDQAGRRRMMAMLMDHTLPKEKEDITYRERFRRDQEVREWCLAMLIEGYIRSLDGGEWESVEKEFADTTRSAADSMFHLSEFLEMLREGDRPKLRYTEPETPGKWPRGTGGRWVTLKAFHGCYDAWVKRYGNRLDRMEALSYPDFNTELEQNHGFVKTKSGDHRWGGWELDTSIDLSELRQATVSLAN